jgi:hypothetical protein
VLLTAVPRLLRSMASMVIWNGFLIDPFAGF